MSILTVMKIFRQQVLLARHIDVNVSHYILITSKQTKFVL